jgi:5-carboxymethyl-2-hydroxymuconate isomerase
VEYTANLRANADIEGLLHKIAEKYRCSGGIFPALGIRVRAIELSHYVVNEGNPADAFVHAICIIAPGRSEEFRQQFFCEMFEIMKAHLGQASGDCFLGLSLDVIEGNDIGSYKYNFCTE